MSRTRPELSKKNKYYISKHRYYELKHFCLQYPEWVEKYKSAIRYPQGIGNTESSEWNDPTGDSVEAMDIWIVSTPLIVAWQLVAANGRIRVVHPLSFLISK